MSKEEINPKINEYYSEKINHLGITPQGVDWNSKESQELRFHQLLKLCKTRDNFTINDLGCGFGALCKFMISHHYSFFYNGYDLSADMIKKAEFFLQEIQNKNLFIGGNLERADYTVASGIFNVRLDISDEKWKNYIIEILHNMNSSSINGFAFNILTKYSDKEYMKDYLYYADPAFFFDYCMRNFSRNVALLHDYGLYEFTIIVRRD